MQQSVRDAFFDFSKQFEGVIHFMYLDVKNLVTTGVGNKIDSIAEAQALPWTVGDTGPAADADTIATEWRLVKSRTDLSSQGGGVFEAITRLRISDDAVADLVSSRLSQNETNLLQTPEFADFANWPADAQLGLLSMAWAAGAAFAQDGRFPDFRADCAVVNFSQAALDSHMAEAGNPGLVLRNLADEMLFVFAARVQAQGKPFDQLIYPRILTTGGDILDMGLPTVASK